MTDIDVRTATPGASWATTKSPRKPAFDGAATFNIHQHPSSVYFLSIGVFIRGYEWGIQALKTDFTRGHCVVHVLLMLIFDEGIASWFSVLSVVNHLDALHRTILLKLASQLALTSVEVYPCSKQSFEGIPHGGIYCIGIPESNFLLQLVSNLFSFLFFSSFSSFFSGLHTHRSWGVHRILKKMNIVRNTLIIVGLFLLVW